MKTFKKFMVMLVAAILAFGSYLAYPLTKIVALVTAESNHEIVKVKNVPSSLNMKENASVVIPFDTSYFTTTGTGVKTVRVYNGMGRVEKEFNEESADFKFTPTSAGIYKIVYGLVDESGIFSRMSSDYTLVVTGESTSFKFAENSEYYLPAKVPAKAGQKVVIPYPSVVLNDGTILNHGDEGYEVSIRVSNKSGSLRMFEEDGYQYVELDDISVLGIYEVRYTYGDTILIKNFEVVNKDNYDTSKLSYTTSISSWTESAIRYKGEQITLPTITVKDSNSNDVTNQVFNKITVKYYVDGKEQANTDNSAFKLEGNKLTVYEDASTDGLSYYEIKYDVKDYFNNEIKNYTFKITNVSSYRNAPTVYAVENYTDDTDKDSLVSVDYLIPSTYNYIADERDTITIPAIYAEDTYGSEEFTYRRSIRFSGEASTTLSEEPNLATTYQITKTGKYILSYTATSTLTAKTYTKEYTIIVVDGVTGSNESVKSTPEIKLPTIPAVMNAGETITINAPTLRDKDSSNTIIDERVQLVVTGAEPIIKNHVITGYKVTASEEDTSITLTFVATNDNGVETKVEKTIKVLATDETPADANITSDYEIDEENSIIRLPSVKFTDENIDYSDISVTVYDPNGKVVTGIKNVTIINGEVTGGEFVAGLSGEYRVVYTAIDPYSNATSILVVITDVKGSTNYVQTGLDGAFPTQAQPNERLTLPGAIFQLNGEVVDNIDYTIKVISSSGSYSFKSATREFEAREEGQYVFAYFFEGKQVSGEYILEVKDTVGPELNISNSYRPQTVVDYDPETTLTVNIPTFKPSDANGISDYGFKVTKDGKEFVKYNSKSLIEEFYKEGEPTVYSFNPKGEGVYVVEYYATDYSGNKTTYTLDSINVGDVDNPVIIINAKIPTTVDKGETITFKASDIVIDDSSSEATYTITVTGPNGKEVKNTGADGIYAFKFTESGTYTMTITADDGHEHVTSEVKTIVVTTENYSSKINTEVLGIILMIVSLLILGGVVFYFFKTREKKPNNKPTKDN